MVPSRGDVLDWVVRLTLLLPNWNMGDLKSNCNEIYLDLVAMIEAINTKFALLLAQDPSTA